MEKCDMAIRIQGSCSSSCGQDDLQAVDAQGEMAVNDAGSLRQYSRNTLSEEKRELWQKKRARKRAQKKEAAASHKEALRVEWEQLSEEKRQERRVLAIQEHERRRLAEEKLVELSQRRLADPALPVLVFDLSFAWCMTVPNVKSTVSQLYYSYSTLRQNGFPLRPVLSSLIGKEAGDTEHDSSIQATLLQCALTNFAGFRRFPPTIAVREHWSELFPKEKVVFLTADATEVLEDIKAGEVYIVGAFVDHNQQKGLSKARAQVHGVRMARLPIKESIELHNRSQVLTIVHLVEVLTAYLSADSGYRDWAKALNDVLPVRRIQQEVLGSRKRRQQKKQSVSGACSAVKESAACEGVAETVVLSDI